jgi:hypothetical protein
LQVKRELRSALKEYQETNGKPFCVFGKSYTGIMDEQEEQEQAKTVKVISLLNILAPKIFLFVNEISLTFNI